MSAPPPAQAKKPRFDDGDEWADPEDEDEAEVAQFEADAPDAALPAFLQAGAGLRSKQEWGRPPLGALGAIEFQTMDVDYTHGPPLPGMPGNTVGPVPVVRVYGVTAEGHSVLVNVHGFLPYLFVQGATCSLSLAVMLTASRQHRPTSNPVTWSCSARCQRSRV